MAPPGDESAASPSPSDAAMEEIVRLLEESAKAIFGGPEPRRALVATERASALIDDVEPEALRPPLRLFLGANHAFAAGMLALRREGDRDEARAHFEEAKRLVEQVRAEHPAFADNGAESFTAFAIGIDVKLLETQIAATSDAAERARLAERRDELARAQLQLGGPSSRAILRSFELFQSAQSAFRESGAALGKLDLEEARRRIDDANRVTDELHALVDEVAGSDETFAWIGELFGAFKPLFAAQQAYVAVLHEAIVGDVRERHVAMLETADDQLRDGLVAVTEALARIDRTMGQVVESAKPDELAASVESQRAVLRNLRHLVKEGLTPREVTRRSAPRFAGYFVIALVVLLGGIRLSGIAETLSGTELLSIVLIALVVAAGSSFGWEAAIRLFEALPLARKRAEVPPGQTHPA